MADLWLTKNPFAEVWMRVSNRVAAFMRGQAIARANRDVKALLAEANSSLALSYKTAHRR